MPLTTPFGLAVPADNINYNIVPYNFTVTSIIVSAHVAPTGEMASNGGYDSDTAWTKGSGVTISGGTANATALTGSMVTQTPATALVLGDYYLITFDVTARSAGSVTPVIGSTSGTARSAIGTYSEVLIAGAGSTLGLTGTGFTGSVDNVTVNRLLRIDVEDFGTGSILSTKATINPSTVSTLQATKPPVVTGGAYPMTAGACSPTTSRKKTTA